VTLSIIVPIYNVAPYLQVCLDSLVAAATRLGGNRDEVELICVDDGSTDGSSEILDTWAVSLTTNHYPLITKVQHQQNAGVSAARNAALDVATGDWIGFVDADDAVDEYWFCRVVEVIGEAPSTDVVYMGKPVSVRDEASPSSGVAECWLPLSEAKKRAYVTRNCVPAVRAGDKARQWGLQNYARYGWPVSNFVRRELVGTIRFPVGVGLKEDVCFFVQIGNRLSCVAEVDFPGYFYTRRDGSAVMRHRSDEDSLRFVSEMLKIGRVEVENCRGDGGFRRAVTTAIGYEFVQWAEERDPSLQYDAETCPIRAAWRKAWEEGLIDLGDMPFFWRPAIRWWVWTGQLWLAKITRRIREWTARFI